MRNLFIFLYVVLCLYASLSAWGTAYNYETADNGEPEFNQLRLGMTWRAVLDLLGQPFANFRILGEDTDDGVERLYFFYDKSPADRSTEILILVGFRNYYLLPMLEYAEMSYFKDSKGYLKIIGKDGGGSDIDLQEIKWEYSEGIKYIKDYKIPGYRFTIQESINDVINYWSTTGRPVEILGWRDRWAGCPKEKIRRGLPADSDVFNFEFVIGLNTYDIAENLKPIPFTPQSFLKQEIAPYFGWVEGEGIKYGRSCIYGFVYDNKSGAVNIAWLDLPESNLFRLPLTPFNLPNNSNEPGAYSDYWPISGQGYLPSPWQRNRRWFSRCEDNETDLNRYSGLYYIVNGELVKEIPENLVGVNTVFYEPGELRKTRRSYDEAGVLEAEYCVSTYDAEGRLTSSRYFVEGNPVVDGIFYKYNAAGNLIEKRDCDGYECYSYDEGGRIAELVCLNVDRKPAAKGLWPHTVQRIKWDYSPQGNMVTETRYDINGDVSGKDVVELW